MQRAPLPPPPALGLLSPGSDSLLTLLNSQRLGGCGWSLGIKEEVETEDGARRGTSGIEDLVKSAKQSPDIAGSESPGRAEETPRFLHPLTAGQVSMGVQCEGHRALRTVSAHKGDASFLQTKPRDVSM